MLYYTKMLYYDMIIFLISFFFRIEILVYLVPLLLLLITNFENIKKIYWKNNEIDIYR